MGAFYSGAMRVALTTAPWRMLQRTIEIVGAFYSGAMLAALQGPRRI